MPDKPKTTKGPLGVLKKKIGPAPVWVWFTVALVGYLVYSRYKSAANNTGGVDTGTTPSTAPGTTMNGSGQPTDSGAAGGGGAGVDPSQLLQAYQMGQSDLGSLLGQYLGAYGYGQYGAYTPVGSGGGPAIQGGQIPTQYYQDQFGNFQPVQQPPNQYVLGYGFYGDVGAPAYQQSLQALTQFWQGLGSPTQLKRPGGNIQPGYVQAKVPAQPQHQTPNFVPVGPINLPKRAPTFQKNPSHTPGLGSRNYAL